MFAVGEEHHTCPYHDELEWVLSKAESTEPEVTHDSIVNPTGLIV